MAGFMCSEGEKKHVVYDEHIESDVTVCRECCQNLPLYKKKETGNKWNLFMFEN